MWFLGFFPSDTGVLIIALGVCLQAAPRVLLLSLIKDKPWIALAIPRGLGFVLVVFCVFFLTFGHEVQTVVSSCT